MSAMQAGDGLVAPICPVFANDIRSGLVRGPVDKSEKTVSAEPYSRNWPACRMPPESAAMIAIRFGSTHALFTAIPR